MTISNNHKSIHGQTKPQLNLVEATPSTQRVHRAVSIETIDHQVVVTTEGNSTTIGEHCQNVRVEWQLMPFFQYFRNPQQSRNFENGSGDSPRGENPATGTYFRNNDRYNGSATTGSRYEGRGGGAAATAGSTNYKPREGNYRAGSGRFSGSASAQAQGSSNSGQRK